MNSLQQKQLKIFSLQKINHTFPIETKAFDGVI